MVALRDRIERDQQTADQAAGLDAGTPNSDGAGNAAWREAKAQLALVQAREREKA